MKVLYVKNNSERAKTYQLKTIIFEKNGTKYVKKEALCTEAISHLKKMKDNYHLLSKSIINPKVKLAPIVDEDENSLTFEFIEGISLEKKFTHALLHKNEHVTNIIEEYVHFLETSFSTTRTVQNDKEENTFKTILQDVEFKHSDDFIYFKDISNIDLIFSNIIYRNDEIYIIDYEWIFPLNLPIHYALYRSLRDIHTHKDIHIESYIEKRHLDIFNVMEENFFDNEVVSEQSFFKTKKNYMQNRVNMYTHLQDFRNQVDHLQNRVAQLEKQLQNSQHEVISYATSKSWKITRPMRKIVNYFKDRK